MLANVASIDGSGVPCGELLGPSMMATWMNTYHDRIQWMLIFDNEQDYIDAMFSMIILFNWGVFLSVEELAIVVD